MNTSKRDVYLLMVFITALFIFCRNATAQLIETQKEAYQLEGMAVTINSMTKGKWAEPYVELNMTIENKSEQPISFLPIDIILLDEKGDQTVPTDAWNNFTMTVTGGFTFMPKLRMRPSFLGVTYAVPKPEDYSPEEKEFYERYSHRLTEELIIAPESKEDVRVFFPKLINFKRIDSLHIRDGISGIKHKITLK